LNLRDRTKNNVFYGLLLIAVCSLVVAAVLAVSLLIPVIKAISGIALIFFSITQLLYVIPLCQQLRKENSMETLKGVIIGAIITFLLNSACFVVVFQQLSVGY